MPADLNEVTRQYLLAHRSETPADLEAALAADYATAQNLDRKALAAFLLAAGLTGTFRAARESQDTQEPIREALLLLQDIVTSGIDYVETTRPEFGGQMVQLLGGLQQAGLLTGDQAAGLVALAGGYRYERLAASEIEVAQAEFERADALASLRSRYESACLAARSVLDNAANDLPAWEDVVAAFAAEGA